MARRLGLLARSGQIQPVGGLIGLLTAVLLALVMIAAPTAAPAAAQESATVASTGSTPGARLCPEVVVLAARGAEDGQTLPPTRYSLQGPWTSNGYEDLTVRAFLQQAETLYGQENGGASLMKDVLVRGLEPWYYPQSGNDTPSRDSGKTSEAVLQTLLLANRLAHPLAQTMTTTANALRATTGDRAGEGTGAVQAVRDFESATDCRPDYILIGSGKGATELAHLEQPLAERDRLAGVLYLGAAQPAVQDPESTEETGGLFRQLTQGRRESEPTSTGPRLSYCLPADTACGDPGASGSRTPTQYTRWDSPADRKIIEAFAAWVDGARD